jgi:Tfp pilus assembly protein PilF
MEAEQSEAAAAQLELLKTSKGVAVLNSVADAFGRLKRYPDCVATVDAAIAIETKSELFVRRGVCKASAEDHAGATSDFKRAIEIDAQSATAHYYLGQSLKKKDKRGAKTAFNKAIALSGDNAKLKAAAEKALAEL